jgi:2-keto-4-pentenoate hydratase/2-oxohepta-3-ene-1,7-dioic acid hydratase in catechol pathway
VKLCMFSPRDSDLARGWPGRVDDDTVTQLAAQTLEAFFTGGGAARAHAEYAVEDVVFRAPVLHPPSIRIFDGDDFRFANPAAIHGPEQTILLPSGVEEIQPVLRVAAVVGAGTIGGYTLMNDWVAPGLDGVKRHDFAISLGPLVVTPDEFEPTDVEWQTLLDHAELNTRLLPGDILAAPGTPQEPVAAGAVVELARPQLGALRNYVAAR